MPRKTKLLESRPGEGARGGGRARVTKGDFGGEFSFRRRTALMVRWRSCSSGSMEDGADGDRRIVRGRRSGVLGAGDGGRRGAGDGAWRRGMLVGRPLTESRGVERAGRLMLDSSVTSGGRVVRGEARQGGAGRSGVIWGGGGAVDDDAAVAAGAAAARPAHGGLGGERQGGELAWEATPWSGGGGGGGGGVEANRGAEAARRPRGRHDALGGVGSSKRRRQRRGCGVAIGARRMLNEGMRSAAQHGVFC